MLSAHRTPDELQKYLKKAVLKGTKVFIAGAGDAAHLPGVIAAQVTVPVIGVPIKTPTLGGVDSLYSIVQMPPGIPVATVGINAAKNAALLALEILSLSDPKLANNYQLFRKKIANDIIEKSDKLQKAGYRSYLKSSIK